MKKIKQNLKVYKHLINESHMPTQQCNFKVLMCMHRTC